MTTILSFCNENTGSILMLGDSQVSQGHLKLPIFFQKIVEIGSSILLASSGSVADSQFLSKEILKSLQIKKIISNDKNLDKIDIQEISQELSEWLFLQNRSYYQRPFESSFLLSGYSQGDEKNILYSVDSDGSIINLPFFAIGSGSELCLASLSSLYESNKIQKLSDDEIAAIMSNILFEATKLDCFTNSIYNVVAIDKNGVIKHFSKRPEIRNEVEIIKPKSKEKKK